jgi:lipoprotein Spr
MRVPAQIHIALGRVVATTLLCFAAALQVCAQQATAGDTPDKKLQPLYRLLYLPKLHTAKPVTGIKIVPPPADLPADSLAGADDIASDEPTDSTAKQPTTLAEPAPVKKTTSKDALFEGETDQLAKRYAYMMDVPSDEVTNLYLYKFIDQWYGVKYKYGGNDDKGIDCSAFSQKLYSSIYNTPIERTSRQQHRNAEKVKNYEEAEEGDLVFFRIHRVRVSHVGVYLANGYFVHASRSRGVMISSLNEKYWNRRFAGCGKVDREETATESDYLQ